MPLALHVICYDLKILEAEGCRMAYPHELFKHLMIATGGDPCTTGCSYFEDGKCPAYQKFHTTPIRLREEQKIDHAKSQTDQSGLIGGKWAGKTIRQIAEMEKISLNEARKRKQAGQYTS